VYADLVFECIIVFIQPPHIPLQQYIEWPKRCDYWSWYYIYSLL